VVLLGLVVWVLIQNRQTRIKLQTFQSPDSTLLLLQQEITALRQNMAENLSSSTQNFQQQLAHIGHRVDHQLSQVSDHLLQAQKTVGDRLEQTTRMMGEIQRSLGSLDQAALRIFDVGRDIASLQEILRAPKLRGSLGELFLGDLLSQILPRKHYDLQYQFKTGDVVDAVIRTGQKLVPVDSKFPLENFQRMLKTQEKEEKESLKRKFVLDVKKHIDAIASKYIQPGEGTFDFAMMYIPAENVYYEVIIKDEIAGEDGALTQYALNKKVIPVSPNSFYAFLQAILLGLRGLHIEEHARLIWESLAKLQNDFSRFKDDFSVLGKHLSNTQTKYFEAEKKLTRFEDNLIGVVKDDKREEHQLSSSHSVSG